MIERCLECGGHAVWIRHTQFAGDHPYCDKHARMEKDFNDEPDSYSFWSNVMVGADIHAGDGGYSIGTQEAHDEFVKKRNEANPELAEVMRNRSTYYGNDV